MRVDGGVPASARDGSITSFDGTKIVYVVLPGGRQGADGDVGPGYSSGRAKETDGYVKALLARATTC